MSSPGEFSDLVRFDVYEVDLRAGEVYKAGRKLKLQIQPFHVLALLSVDEETAAEREKLDAVNDDVGLSLLIASHKILMVPNRTPVRILEVQQTPSRCQVRILEGEHYGKTALVPTKLLAELPEL